MGAKDKKRKAEIHVRPQRSTAKETTKEALYRRRKLFAKLERMESEWAVRQCTAQATRILREEAKVVYDSSFEHIRSFLVESGGMGMGMESSQATTVALTTAAMTWDQVRAWATGQSSSSSSSSCLAGKTGGDKFTSATTLGLQGYLIPCALVQCSAHMNDRPWLLSMLNTHLGQSTQYPSSSSSCPIVCMIRTTYRMDITTILKGIYDQIQLYDCVTGGQQLASSSCTSTAAASSSTCPSSFSSSLPASQESTAPLDGDEGTLTTSTCLLEDVVEAYQQLVRRLRREGLATPPVVLLMFEDVESLPNHLLDSLLHLLADVLDQEGGGNGSGTIPFRLLFLVAPSFHFGRSLSEAVSTRLSIRSFTLPPATLVFDKLVERLFVDNECPVALGGSVLRFLHDRFNESHGTITTFISQLSLAFDQHFIDPLSVLCLVPYAPAAPSSSHHEAMSEERHFRRYTFQGEVYPSPNTMEWQMQIVQSAGDHFQTSGPTTSTTGNTSDATTNGAPITLSQAVEKEVRDRCRMRVGIRIIHMAMSMLLARDEVPSLLVAYESLLEGSAAWTNLHNTLLTALNQAPVNILDRLTAEWLKMIKCLSVSLPSFVVGDGATHRDTLGIMQWREVIIEVRKMVVVLLKETRGGSSSDINSNSSSSSRLNQQRHQEGADDEESNRRKHFSIILKGILMEMHGLMSNITEVCRTTLMSQEKMLTQYYWFTDLEALKHHLQAQPRSTLVHRLARPVETLQCGCCEDNRLTSSYPDACTLYALYEDQANRIFPLEALEITFHDVMMADGDEDDGHHDDEEGEAERGDEEQEGGEGEEEEGKAKGRKGKGKPNESIKRLRVRFEQGMCNLEKAGFLRPVGNGEKMAKMIYAYTMRG